MSSQPQEHSEADLLTQFLLPPAPLSMSISLADFKSLFPASARSSKDIAVLYRELQHQVALGIDDVKRNIQAEVAASEVTRAHIRKAKGRMDRAGLDELEDADTREIDIAMNGPTDDLTISNVHTERSLIKEMELACTHIEDEIADMETECDDILSNLQTIIGDLSDLRYGKLNAGVKEEAVESMQRVLEACNQARANNNPKKFLI